MIRSSMPVRATLLLIALLALGVPAPMPAQAQALAWPASIQLSAGGGAAYSPRVIFDDEGFAHVAYFGGATQDAWAIYYTNNRTGAWAAPRLISAASGDQRLGAIAIGPDGHVHVVYERRADSEIYYVESTDLGQTWGGPRNLSRSGGRAYEPALAVDAANTLHVVWSDTRWSGVVQTTYVARPAGGAFSAPIKIGTPALFESGPSIAVTSGATPGVHVVFQARERALNDSGSFDVFYVSGVGGRFQPPRNFSNDRNIWSLNPQIVSDGGQELYLTWDSEINTQHEIVLARSRDAGITWTEAINVSRTPIASLAPRLAFGRDQGRPQLHIVWAEDVVTGRRVFYLRYDPQTNSFGSAVEQVNSVPIGDAPDVGAALSVTQVAVVYEGGAGAPQVYLSSRGQGAIVTAALALNGGAALSTSRDLSVTFDGAQGDPVEMRYALGRAPVDSDPWLPFQPSFSLSVPRDGGCQYTLYAQLRAADDRRSKLLQATIQVDSEVQATVALHNPYFDGLNSDPDYTNRPSFAVSVADSGECGRLTTLLVAGSRQEFQIDNRGFANSFVLPGPLADGPRPVSARVTDSAGNRLTVTRVITLDTVAPELLSGRLRSDAPAAGLAMPRARLALDGLDTRDNLYPGGAWGVLIANVADPALADSDPALSWRPVAFRAGTQTIEGWNILAGLGRGPADRSLAGKQIQVRVRLLDGAGNPSPQTLTTTVLLAQDYRPLEAYMPLALR